MKKQVFYIHGASSYSNYEAFLNDLKTKTLRELPGEPQFNKWPSTLAKELGDEFEVFAPTMPNKQNAKYNEWKIWFERHLEFLQDDVVLVGWSQGGYFLSKYLIENDFPVAIKALFLLAAPFKHGDFVGEDGGDFGFDTERAGELSEKAENIFVLHSKDDFVVSYEHALLYKEKLPAAELVTFEDKNHFLVEKLPELIEKIKSVV